MDKNVYDFLEKRQQQQNAPVAAVPPPPGVTPNFDHPVHATRSGDIFVAIGVTISGLFILIRIYTKAYILRNFGGEDVSIILAFICTVVCCAACLKGAEYGTGRHIWDIPINVFIPKWGQWVTAATVLYCPSMMFAKLAILLCYLRISPQTYFRLAVYIAIGIVVSYNIALMCALVFGCSPIAKAWDVRITEGKCIDRPAVYLANGILNVITDFIILLLPVPMIRGLQMPFRQKLLIGAMFSIGSLACIVSILRLKTLIPTLHNPDQTWAVAVPGIWVIVEINLAVACGCLSVIRPFLRHHMPFLLGETRARAKSSSNRYSKARPSDYFISSNRSGNNKQLRGEQREPPWAQNHIYGDDIPLDSEFKGTHAIGTGLGQAETHAYAVGGGSDPEIGSPAKRSWEDTGEIGKMRIVSPKKALTSRTPVSARDETRTRDESWAPDIPRYSGSGGGNGLNGLGGSGIVKTLEVDVSDAKR